MTFLELSLSGGVFVLAIAAFRGLTLRRLPKGTFVALWWLAAARLLLPVELASRFSVYTLLEALGPKSVPVAPDALPAPVVPAAPSVPAAPPVIAIPAQPAAVPAPAPFPVWTALWLTVGLLLAAWFLIRYVRWRRRFREALPADCPGLETWFQLRRKVEVRVTDQIAAPLTYGLFRPVILLPKTMDFKDEEALTCVLAHERAHIRRLDGLLKLALTTVVCLHWFNPAVWLLYVLGNRDMELRCDEAAVLALGEDSRERYALALIRLAENRNVPLCGFAHRNGMEERIKAIMSIKKKSLLACAVALALVMSITTAFATSAKPQGAEPAKSEAHTAAKKPEVSAPVKKTDAPVPAEDTEEPAPMEKPEAPAPEKEDAPPEALAPEAAPAANMEAPKTAVKGTPIYAAGKGTIKETGFNTKDGNFVRIDHGSGQESFYAHCASVLVKTGDAVTSGQTIATIGSSGMSTGPHLHFKFLVNGVATDPLAFVAANDGKSQLNLFTASIGTFHEDADGEPSLEGNPIIALQDGTILAAGVKNYGPSDARKPYVQISYQSGYTMLFSRCKEVLVKTGDAVKAGDIIAYTGKSAGGTYPAPTEETESMLDAEARWKEWADENLVNGDYPRNSKGETYDSLIGCEYLGYEPDLIEVAGPELEGYVATKELHFPDFGAGTENCYKHAEESAAYRNWVEENQISRVVLPMYDEEHNVIGEWETGAVCGVPRGKTITYAELVEASKQGWPNANGSQEVYREPEFKTIEEAQEAVRNGWPEQ